MGPSFYKCRPRSFEYRGTLSANSPVFKDMFTVPPPQEDGELVEGCSVVHLQDSVDDWKCVLKALHERR